MGQIYLPGHGMVDLSVKRAHDAAVEYDERLSFKLHEESQQYAVYISMPHGSDPPELPVLGFGYEVPHPDEVKRRLYEADSLRHGDELRRDMNRRNAERLKEQEYARSQKVADGAERIEHGVRKLDLTNYKKSFRKHTHSAKRAPKR